jgi:hypothetical protein
MDNCQLLMVNGKSGCTIYVAGFIISILFLLPKIIIYELQYVPNGSLAHNVLVSIILYFVQLSVLLPKR